jgi:hypothetical protein
VPVMPMLGGREEWLSPTNKGIVAARTVARIRSPQGVVEGLNSH